MNTLIICDMINDFANPNGALYSPRIGAIVPAVKEYLDSFRDYSRPVAWLVDSHRQGDAEFRQFPPHGLQGFGREIIPALAPYVIASLNEHVVHKRRFSGFQGTDLEQTLREWDTRQITLVGDCTDICVLYTAADARALGYEVRIPEKAVATFRDDQWQSMALRMLEENLGCEIIRAKAQFCANCLRTTTDYTTSVMTDSRRFHFCADTTACAAARVVAEKGGRA